MSGGSLDAMDKLKSVLSGEEARRDDRTVLEVNMKWEKETPGLVNSALNELHPDPEFTVPLCRR